MGQAWAGVLAICDPGAAARGILSPPPRSPSGYRRYPPDVVRLLAFVAQARRLGLTLAEIRYVVALRRDGSAPCLHIRTRLEQKAADLDANSVLGCSLPHPTRASP